MPARRRALLGATAALPLVAIRIRPAAAAEFTYKIANNTPGHPSFDDPDGRSRRQDQGRHGRAA